MLFIIAIFMITIPLLLPSSGEICPQTGWGVAQLHSVPGKEHRVVYLKQG